VSIAYAGFSGVVGVFGGGSKLSEAERSFRVRLLITASLSAFFASIVPLALAQFTDSGRVVWSIASLLLAGYIAFASVDVRRRVRSLEGYSQPRFAPVVYTVSAALAVSLILGAAHLLPAHAIYISSIVWQLALASLHFVLLVVESSPRTAA